MGDLTHRSGHPSGTQRKWRKKPQLSTNHGLARGAALLLLAGVFLWVGMGQLLAQPPANPSGTGSPGTPPVPTNLLEVFSVDIKPNAPVRELLPLPPKYQAPLEPVFTTDPSEVPELCFQEPISPQMPFGIGLKHLLNVATKIKVLNERKVDGFLKELVASRPDLQGLPFDMDDDCRLNEQQSKEFRGALDLFRVAVTESQFVKPPMRNSASAQKFATPFWFSFRDMEYNLDAGERDNLGMPGRGATPIQHPYATRLSLLTHIMGGAMEPMRLGFVQYLGGTPRVEATQALARLVLFAPEPEVQAAAIDALKVRREKDYADILVDGLRYPWPEVAARASNALVRLEHTGTVARLVDLLEEPDPRLPMAETIEDKKVYTARQLVRLNHHQNCFLCHAPMIPPNRLPAHIVTAPVPLPSRPLPPFTTNEYYNSSQSQISVRLDVTYLRPDFSMLLKVPDAKPWPELQRFDFVVRTVTMTEKEARDYETKFQQAMAGSDSPYIQAVLYALRELTNLDAGTTAPQWRKALKVAG